VSQHEKFEAWFKARWPEFEHPTTSAFEVWQASRRAALEECAKSLEDDYKSALSPVTVLDCVDFIRALAKETNNG
jgi:hypothetical protein